MKLEHDTLSRDTFSALFSGLDPDCRKRVLLRLAAGRAERLGSDVIAIDGVVLALTRESALIRVRVAPSCSKQSVRGKPRRTNWKGCFFLNLVSQS